MLVNLLEPPQALCECGPRPVYLQSKQDCSEYFVITLNGINDGERMVQIRDRPTYIYNFETDRFEIYKQYPANLTPLYHGHAVDPESNELHIFGGDKHIYATLNIETKTLTSEWNIKCADYKTGFLSKFSKNKTHTQYGLDKLDIDRPEAIFLPAPFNELHIFTNTNKDSILHIKFDASKQKFVCVSELNNLKLFPGSPVLYDETHRRVIMFGGFNTNTFKSQIWHCDLYEEQTEYKWELFQTVIPQQSNYFDVVLAIFDCVAIVFYFSDYDKKEIWCYDMQFNKWYKSHIKYPDNKGKAFAIKTNNGWVHFLSFQRGYANRCHFKIKILSLLPQILVEKFSNKFECLIYGYCKEMDDCIENRIIPVDIIKLIFEYHPLFNDMGKQSYRKYGRQSYRKYDEMEDIPYV